MKGEKCVGVVRSKFGLLQHSAPGDRVPWQTLPGAMANLVASLDR